MFFVTVAPVFDDNKHYKSISLRFSHFVSVEKCFSAAALLLAFDNDFYYCLIIVYWARFRGVVFVDQYHGLLS